MARGARWTEEELKAYERKKLKSLPEPKPKPKKKPAKQMALDGFLKTVKLAGLPKPELEFRFHKTRKWRIDCCFVKDKLAIEIEGAVWTNGRHTRGSGFVRDMTKYNELSIMGYGLLRFTPEQVRSGEALHEILRWYEERKKK